MPTCIPTVTKDPTVRFPSTWKDPKGKPLTDSMIRQYAREGRYGPAEQQRQQMRDAARLFDGILVLGNLCLTCKKVVGTYQRFSYLPKAGHYCLKCRNEHRDEAERQREEKAKYSRLETFE